MHFFGTFLDRGETCIKSSRKGEISDLGENLCRKLRLEEENKVFFGGEENTAHKIEFSVKILLF